ncbi:MULTISPECIES: hypothetical protein [Sphingobium]|jgi:hypothetical protein|uniref:GAF domain-containing protein n=1 Tax=Sphingobium tyrosinilyticum TaxID=2715436 RepID=A0ABV9F2J3_9SPHN|nr:hypothetical protein [Sphingobium sp. EP60837]ANI76561.1 hypothetical protein EP837_00106 [Sphingobium sp. EP60837]
MLKQRPIFLQCAEMLVMFAVLMAIDHMLLDADAFQQLNPNPYWLPVLAMAISYGTGIGLLAGLVASAIWLSTPHAGLDMPDQLEMQLRLSIMPLLWMVTALVAGEVTAVRMARLAAQDERHQAMDNNWQRLAEVIARLTSINRKLQVRIAIEQRTVNQAVAAAVGLAEPDPALQIDAIARLIALAAQTEDFTFYDIRAGQVVARFAGRDAAGRPADLSRTALAHAMMENPRPLHEGHSTEQGILAHFGLIALPVFRDEDELGGMIIIHSAPNLRITEARVAELAHMAELFGNCSALFGGEHMFAQGKWLVPGGKVA